MFKLMLALAIGALTAADQPKTKLCDKEIQDRLSKKITIAGDAGGPLCDAAGYLCALVDVPLAFDQKAFGHHVQAELVQLKGGTDVPVATALQQLLDQSNATYEIRDGKIVIVPNRKLKNR
jgi:hypothetical protein